MLTERSDKFEDNKCFFILLLDLTLQVDIIFISEIYEYEILAMSLLYGRKLHFYESKTKNMFFDIILIVPFQTKRYVSFIQL